MGDNEEQKEQEVEVEAEIEFEQQVAKMNLAASGGRQSTLKKSRRLT